MREMVLRGPLQYDCLLIYENLAIDYLAGPRATGGVSFMSTIQSPISGTRIPAS